MSSRRIGACWRSPAALRSPRASCAVLRPACGRAPRPYTIAQGECIVHLRRRIAGRPACPHGDALVVAQVALSVVVLVGAGLLVRTLHKLQTLDPGFDTQNVLLFGINPAWPDTRTTKRRALPAVAGAVRSAARRGVCQLFRGCALKRKLVRHRCAPRRCASQIECPTALCSGWELDFFRTMGIPVLAGRVFTPADFASAEATNAAMTAAAEAAASSAERQQPRPRPPNGVAAGSRTGSRQSSVCQEILPQPESLGPAYGQCARR